MNRLLSISSFALCAALPMCVFGLQLTQVTFDNPEVGNCESDPAWSPDGSLLAFSVSAQSPNAYDPGFYIGIAAVAGGSAPVWDPSVYGNEHPAWSPDGTQLAFANHAYGPFGLFIAPFGHHQPATELVAGFLFNPVWSPNANTIAFERSGQIWSIPAAGGAETQVTSGAGGHNPAWSPDGSKLAYDSGGKIWVLNVSTHASAQITNSTTDEHPTWSPDGNWLAFSSRRNGPAAIWVVSAAGGDPVQLTTGATDDMDPAWSPDGHSIAFSAVRGSVCEHIWIATDLPNFTLGTTSATWTQIKDLYRR